MQTVPGIKNKLFLFLLLFASSVSQSFSQQNNPYHFFIEAGGFATSVKTSVRVDATDGSTGSVLELESRGLAAHPMIFRLDGLVKLKRRSSFAFTGLTINRNNSYVLDEDINVGDSTYPMGTDITTKFNTAYLGLTYRYAIFFKKEWEAGASVGMRLLNIKAGIKPVSEEFANTGNLAAPVPSPVIGMFVNYNILPKLNITGTVELMQVTISGIKGTVVDNRIATQYYFWKNFSAGVAYSFNRYNVDNVPLNDDYSSEIDYRFSGFTFFLGYRF